MPIILTALAIASILYGLFIMSLGSGTWFFAFWLVLGAVLLAAALAVHLGWWKVLPPLARRAGGIAAVALAVGFLVTQACIFSEFYDQGDEGLDYLIVLGAQVRDDGPSVVLRHRLDAACEYLEANPGTTCIVSGGQSPSEPMTEADSMADYLIGRGIAPDRIVVEGRSTNTKENIGFSSSFLDPETGSVGIVTNNFHVFRGVAIARKAGFASVQGIAAPSNLDVLPNNLVRESLGIAKDFLAGNL